LNELNQRSALPEKALALIQANETKYPAKSRVDYERIRELLNGQPEQIASAYLGEPTSKNSREWRYGSLKECVVTLRGSHAGKWYNHMHGVGGDMLKLISHTTGIAYGKSLVEEASRFLGGYIPQKTAIDFRIQKKDPKNDGLKEEQNAELKKRLSAVSAIVKSTVPIEGTLAERYLREHRGIDGDLSSSNLRYHPALKNWMTRTVHPALVATARNAQGEIVGLQATFLDPTTAKKADLKQNTKLSRGLTSEGALIHQGKSDGVMAYAEGLETALSVAQGHPDWNVHLTFGVTNFAKVPLKAESQSVVLCADNDGVDSGTAKTLEKTAQKLAAKGKEVYVALPTKPNSIHKYDFNDLLKHDGKEAVKDALDNRTLYKQAVTPKTLKAQLAPYVSRLSEHDAIDRKNEKVTPGEFSFPDKTYWTSDVVKKEILALENEKHPAVKSLLRLYALGERKDFSPLVVKSLNEALSKWDEHPKLKSKLAERASILLSTSLNIAKGHEQDISH
ncbi:MAG: toprim domain-containing protein, partial [Gammaproteobacteria bacterium]|nr:toprim domain-containing protein [Gammaproteobacteria bacterium]